MGTAGPVLVTGGAGFIGSHLCEALLADGERVVCLDSFDPFYPRQLKEQNLAACRSSDRFQLAELDIREAGAVAALVAEARPRAIVHLAARAGVRPSLEDPLTYADVNVRGTVAVLEAARLAGVQNVVFASSSSVYGARADAPFRESDSTDRPLSPYGATKKAGEALCYAHHHAHGLSVACLRFFTVYGPRQRSDLAIRKFAAKMIAGEEIAVYGDGRSRRDYTHVRDILSGILGALHWVAAAETRYGIFNLGSSSPITLTELVAALERATGTAAKVRRLPDQPGDVPQTFADTTLAEAELGFSRQVDFEDGLREFVDWLRQQV
jgi:UDP-glucuronate 4-epimerase